MNSTSPLSSLPEAVPAWRGTEAVDAGTSLLLEASAGTGKTWQIAHLVARLVAEQDLKIDRILLITFTTAATAELRDRVRRRLAEVQQALARETQAESADPLLRSLCAGSQRPAKLARVTAALTGFDQAPISTIHGFCQRMLTQLAFESGQSPGLEVLAEAQPLADELISDELAQLFAHADECGVATAQALGWTRAGLMALAKPMLSAVAPQLEPPVGAEAPRLLEVLGQWQQHAAELLAWLEDPQGGRAALAEFLAELERPTTPTVKSGLAARRFPGTYRAKPAQWDQELRRWLVAGAPASEFKDVQAAWDIAKAKSYWRDAQPFEEFAGAALFLRVAELGQQLRQLSARVRSGFAQRVRRHIDAELERRGVVSYDAMLWRLAERVEAEGPQGALATAIRQRFDVALVDEFQDTDAAQWAVLSAAFRCADRRLLLIGDPKQAIYAFRGADVHVYLQAAAGTPEQRPLRATMATNWRSDPALVQAMNHLWAAQSQAFGSVPFDYIEVSAARQQPAQALKGVRTDGEPRRALELRWLDARAESPDSPAGAISAKDRATALVVRALVREVVDLLGPQTELLPVKAGQDLQKYQVRPQDLAVLVRTNLQGELVRQALAAAGVAAVASSADAVVQSEAADWLLAWLDALAQPAYEKSARSAVVTPVFGWTLAELADALRTHQDLQQPADRGDEPMRPAAAARVWGDWLAELADWAGRWHQRGFVAIWEQALAKHGALPRLLASERGERHATDLRHLVELCHAEDRAHRHGPAGLADWLRAQRTEASEEQSLRLESDAAAVQIVTIHKSKGLEYPIVLAPFLWETRQALKDSGQPLLYHGAIGPVLNLHSAAAPERQAVMALLTQERRQEEARVLYVALTRAVHHVVAWLIPAGDTADRPADNAFTHLLLRQRDEHGCWVSDELPPALAAAKPGVAPSDPAPWLERLEALCATSQGTIGLRVEQPLSGPPLRAQPQELRPLVLQPLHWSGRRLSDGWMVASYSSLTRNRSWDADDHRLQVRPIAADMASGLDPTQQKGQTPVENLPLLPAQGLADEATQLDDLAQEQSEEPEVLQAWRALGAGTDVGTWVHGILEHLEFATGAAKDGRPVQQLAADLGHRYGIRRENQFAALRGLVPQWLSTPLDAPQGLPAGFTLRQLARADRLDELPFDLALGQTQQDDRRLRSAEVHHALRTAIEHSQAVHPEAGLWLLAALEDGSLFPQIHGILTGTIDLVLRAGGRFYVADYKTNRLKNSLGEILVAAAYTRAELARAMAEHGYHLQALLYTVALHRWLRQRLGARYSYDSHLGGHLYLFLRGMDGGQQRGQDGACSGVFVDRWPREVVEALDQALWPQARDGGGHQ